VKTLLVLLLAANLVAAYDEKAYADALAKYAKWQETYGTVRAQRQTTNRREGIFLPHRPKAAGGKQFGLNNNYFSNVLTQSVLDASVLNEVESDSNNLIRGTRNPTSNVIQSGAGLTGHRSNGGVPLYKLRKRYPHGYGRRKRSAEPQGWILLDPATGRPVQPVQPAQQQVDFSENSGPDQNRHERDPSQAVDLSNVAQTQYQDVSDEFGYRSDRYHKRYPYGG